MATLLKDTSDLGTATNSLLTSSQFTTGLQTVILPLVTSVKFEVDLKDVVAPLLTSAKFEKAIENAVSQLLTSAKFGVDLKDAVSPLLTRSRFDAQEVLSAAEFKDRTCRLLICEWFEVHYETLLTAHDFKEWIEPLSTFDGRDAEFV